MTEQIESPDWWLEVEADPAYQLEESAAELALEVSVMLRHAKEARPDIDQKALAKLLQVSEGRVSQVLNGDGNIHVATFAKYMRALGYKVGLTPVVEDESAPSLVRETRRNLVAHSYRTTFVDKSGTYDDVRVIVTPSSSPRVPLDRPQLLGSVHLSHKKRNYSNLNEQAEGKPRMLPVVESENELVS